MTSELFHSYSSAENCRKTCQHDRRTKNLWMFGACIAILTTSTFTSQAHAQAGTPNLVSACSGVSLPRSVVTDIMSPVINGVVAPVEGTVNSLLGVLSVIPLVPNLNIDTTTLLNNAANGQPITLQVLNSNGTVVGPADSCDLTADSYSLNTEGGISIGGNRITGLGTNGQEATAGEQNSIAFGNFASTDASAASAIALGTNAQVGANATGAIALGAGSQVTAANSVALGANSTAARGALTGYTAFGLAASQTSTGEISVGAPGAERQITNVAAGSAATDAVNVAQLAGVAADLGGLSNTAVTYDDVSKTTVTLAGAGGTSISNLAPGNVSAGSTDAVNGSQLFATNTNVTNITNSIQNGAVGPVQYSNAASPGVPNGGTPTNDLALVGVAAAPVGLHNVADGNVSAGSNDAVNGGQLYAVNTDLQALQGLAVQYDDAARTSVSLGTIGTPVSMTNVADGTLAANSTDAVNGSQLFATNGNVTNNTTMITNLTTNVQNGALGPLQYSNAGTPNTPNGGLKTNDVALVGANAAPVALHNVAAGAVAAGSTDAVNGDQLYALSDQVGTLNGLAVQYDDATRTSVTLGAAGSSAVTVSNVANGSLGSGSTDAVNGSQLADLGSSVANAIGGNSTYNPATNTVATSVAYGGNNYNSIQSAFDAVLGSVSGGEGNRYFRVQSTLGAANVNADDSMAIGPEASATAANSVALGTQSLASRGAQTGYAATGLAALQSSAGEVSVGATGQERQITNVAAGSSPTDAVNVAQLDGVANQVAALGSSSVQYDNSSHDTISLDGAGGTTITNVAAGDVSSGSSDAVNGGQLYQTNVNVSNNTTAITNLSNSISNGSAGPVQYSNAADPTTPNGGTKSDDLTLVGTGSGPVALHNVANGSISAGSTDAVNGGQVYALAQTAVNAVSYDTDADGNRTNTVTLAGGDTTQPVQVRNVANGTVAADLTDAVNGGQLYTTNQAVGAAQSTADTALALGQNSVQYDDSSHTSVTLGEGNSQAVALHNVAAGTSATDAVNLQQLNNGLASTLGEAKAYTDERFTALSFDLRDVRRDGFAGTAGALAAASLPQAYEAGKGMIAIAGGTYRGEFGLCLRVLQSHGG